MLFVHFPCAYTSWIAKCPNITEQKDTHCQMFLLVVNDCASSLAITRDLVFKMSIDMLLQTAAGEVQVADGVLAFVGSLQVMGGEGVGEAHV